MIPLVHDFDGERVLIVGGGAVGARQSRLFAQEASVLVISPAFVDESFGGAQRIRAAPTPSDVSHLLATVAPVLVVAATDDPPLNEAIETAAHEQGVLVNRADGAGLRGPGSVILPASEGVWKDLDTEGANPYEHAVAVIEETTGAALAGDHP